MDKIAAITTFTKVVEHGSFSKAAKDLRTSQATVSKRVADLEATLGVQLLTRNSRNQSLSEAGHIYYEKCLGVLEALEDADAVARTQIARPSGLLRISLPDDFSPLMAPLVQDFLQTYPDIQLELLYDNNLVNFVSSGIDIAIRISHLDDSSLIAKPVCHTQLVIVASPQYLTQYGVPKTTADLASHHGIGYTLEPHLWHAVGPIKTIRLFCNNGLAIIAAAHAHTGVALLPQWSAYPHIQAGTLVQVLPAIKTKPIPINLVYARRRHLPLKIQTFIAFIEQALSGHPAFIYTN